MSNYIKSRASNRDTRSVSDSMAQSIGMLKAVIGGETFQAVAVKFAKSRTAVERRVKHLAAQLNEAVGIQGLNEGGTAFVYRLRKHQDAILLALESFEPTGTVRPRTIRVLSREEITRAVLRIKGRSSRPWHDVALFYLLFCTGARPLEIARLEVRDYLDADGSVRRESQMRAEVSISGKARRLYFTSTRLDDALGAYLKERLDQGLGLGADGTFRGLDPHSRLFLSATGEGFQIKRYGVDGQRRFLCRPILETYAKLFRYSELDGVTALSARRTVISMLCERGADERQIGELLGISERSAVREMISKLRPTIKFLVDELI